MASNQHHILKNRPTIIILMRIFHDLVYVHRFQVFFCVLVGTFSIGNITPHVTTVAGAKGAAAVLIDIIDNVSYMY